MFKLLVVVLFLAIAGCKTAPVNPPPVVTPPNPIIAEVGPGKQYATVQEAINKNQGRAKDQLLYIKVYGQWPDRKIVDVDSAIPVEIERQK